MSHELSVRLAAGEWVEVRSKEEVLATLDHQGRLEGMPFMPEMLKFCGSRVRVFKRAHKTCDTVNHPAGRRCRQPTRGPAACPPCGAEGGWPGLSPPATIAATIPKIKS
mgnify:CR=1 FL=1